MRDRRMADGSSGIVGSVYRSGSESMKLSVVFSSYPAGIPETFTRK
jgi:hypothetical protein